MIILKHSSDSHCAQKNSSPQSQTLSPSLHHSNITLNMIYYFIPIQWKCASSEKNVFVFCTVTDCRKAIAFRQECKRLHNCKHDTFYSLTIYQQPQFHVVIVTLSNTYTNCTLKQWHLSHLISSALSCNIVCYVVTKKRSCNLRRGFSRQQLMFPHIEAKTRGALMQGSHQ